MLQLWEAWAAVSSGGRDGSGRGADDAPVEDGDYDAFDVSAVPANASGGGMAGNKGSQEQENMDMM